MVDNFFILFSVCFRGIAVLRIMYQQGYRRGIGANQVKRSGTKARSATGILPIAPPKPIAKIRGNSRQKFRCVVYIKPNPVTPPQSACDPTYQIANSTATDEGPTNEDRPGPKGVSVKRHGQ